jgi:hypothetical protein
MRGAPDGATVRQGWQFLSSRARDGGLGRKIEAFSGCKYSNFYHLFDFYKQIIRYKNHIINFNLKVEKNIIIIAIGKHSVWFFDRKKALCPQPARHYTSRRIQS